MFVGYEQIAVSNTVLTVAALTIPPGAAYAELQAGPAGGVRYTMDNTTNPTQTFGMVLSGSALLNIITKEFIIEDIRRIRFIRDGAVDTLLNIHYSGGGIT